METVVVGVVALALGVGAGSLLGFSFTVVSALVPLTVMVTTLATLVYLQSRFVDQPEGTEVDAHQVFALAVQLVEALAEGADGRALQDAPAAAREREADPRMGQRELRDHAGDLRRFGGVRLQEFPARGRVVEKVLHEHRGAGNGGGGAVGDLAQRGLVREEVRQIEDFEFLGAERSKFR